MVWTLGTVASAPAGATPAGWMMCHGHRATIVGTANDDRIRGTRGPDVIAALGGNDIVVALAGNDRVCGGSGRDDLDAGPGADHMYGGPGNDELLPSRGHDVLVGGPNPPVGWPVRRPADTISYGNQAHRLVLDVPAHTADVGPDHDTVIGMEEFWGTQHGDEMRGGSADETFFGDAGPDDIAGGAGRDVIEAMGGDDRVTGGPGPDYAGLFGGSDRFIDRHGRSWVYDYSPFISDDTGVIRTGPKRDSVDIGGSRFTVSTGAGDDSVLLRASVMSGGVDTGAGDDQLSLTGDNKDFATGNPMSLRLGSGDDILHAQFAHWGDGTEVFGGPGADVVSAHGFETPVDIVLGATGSVTTLSHISAVGFESGKGGAGPDTITGSDGDNQITGFAGDDMINALGGNDHIDGGAGNDTADAGAGQDTCVNVETATACETAPTTQTLHPVPLRTAVQAPTRHR
jgi:Ca2+-binding RTX toxin-like protein